MKVGGKRPRRRPRLRWMDRVRSDLKQHQLDPKLTQNREAWRKAVMAIDPNRDKIGKDEQCRVSIIVGATCAIIRVTVQCMYLVGAMYVTITVTVQCTYNIWCNVCNYQESILSKMSGNPEGIPR